MSLPKLWRVKNMARKVPQTTSSGSSDPATVGSPATASRGGASKFKSVKTVLDGITFDSKKEAARWAELKLLERAGLIKNLERQQVIEARINGVLVFTYKADFSYFDANTRVIEDVKSAYTRTLPVYRIKKKTLEALYPGLKITEVM